MLHKLEIYINHKVSNDRMSESKVSDGINKNKILK